MSQLCSNCLQQHAKRRRDPPHSRLKPVGEARHFSSHIGASREQDFQCRDCGATWLYDSDKGGGGWLLMAEE